MGRPFHDATITNQEISHRGLRLIAEQDRADNDAGHIETVPRSGQVRGASPFSPINRANLDRLVSPFVMQ